MVSFIIQYNIKILWDHRRYAVRRYAAQTCNYSSRFFLVLLSGTRLTDLSHSRINFLRRVLKISDRFSWVLHWPVEILLLTSNRTHTKQNQCACPERDSNLQFQCSSSPRPSNDHWSMTFTFMSYNDTGESPRGHSWQNQSRYVLECLLCFYICYVNSVSCDCIYLQIWKSQWFVSGLNTGVWHWNCVGNSVIATWTDAALKLCQ